MDLYTQFFDEAGKQGECVKLAPQLLADIDNNLHTGKLDIFYPASECACLRLAEVFTEFKKSACYQSLGVVVSFDSPMSQTSRTVPKIANNMQMTFVMKVKGTKRSRTIFTKKKEKVLTIGRDKSNSVVIEDSRVSRSHARIQCSDGQCEFIDLGSSCGSKLNGKIILRAKLQAGDVIEIGQSTLICTLKKKKKFWFFNLFG